MNDRRSRIRYSVCSSERLWSDCSTTILNFKIASEGLRPALLLRSSGFVSVTLSMSARKSSHRTIFLIVSSGSPLALIASSLRSTSKKPVCRMTRSLHPPMAHCGQRASFAATWREEFFEVPLNKIFDCFMFFNELEILSIRLKELYDVVHRFVIIEAPVTHQGKPKPLYFHENSERFRTFSDKIHHVVVRDMP